MADVIKVSVVAKPVIRVSAPAVIKVVATGAVQTGWQKGTGTGMAATGTKVYIGPSSGTPLAPATNDIWIQTG
jgi:hypothetical protein